MSNFSTEYCSFMNRASRYLATYGASCMVGSRVCQFLVVYLFSADGARSPGSTTCGTARWRMWKVVGSVQGGRPARGGGPSGQILRKHMWLARAICVAAVCAREPWELWRLGRWGGGSCMYRYARTLQSREGQCGGPWCRKPHDRRLLACGCTFGRLHW